MPVGPWGACGWGTPPPPSARARRWSGWHCVCVATTAQMVKQLCAAAQDRATTSGRTAGLKCYPASPVEGAKDAGVLKSWLIVANLRRCGTLRATRHGTAYDPVRGITATRGWHGNCSA